MKFIPLSYFSAAESGSALTQVCYCDEAILTFPSGGSSKSRLVTSTLCNLDSFAGCYSAGPSGGTSTIRIAKGTNVTITAPFGCDQGSAPTLTYNRNFCPSKYDFSIWKWTIINCATGITYVAAFYNFNEFLQTEQVYNFTDINSLSGGNIPNGCYRIGNITTSASQMGSNFFNPQNYTSYSSCNECISST